jgi:hypothetical protein
VSCMAPPTLHCAQGAIGRRRHRRRWAAGGGRRRLQPSHCPLTRPARTPPPRAAFANRTFFEADAGAAAPAFLRFREQRPMSTPPRAAGHRESKSGVCLTFWWLQASLISPWLPRSAALGRGPRLVVGRALLMALSVAMGVVWRHMMFGWRRGEEKVKAPAPAAERRHGRSAARVPTATACGAPAPNYITVNAQLQEFTGI